MPPCPAPETCLCFLIRHGATDNNRAVPPRLQGRRTDPPLSAEGLEQSRRAAEALAAEPIACVFSSPLLRARQTAEAIAMPRGLEVEIDDGLIECDVGLWEGLSWEEVQERYPEAHAQFHRSPVENPYLGGENLLAVQSRVVPVIDNLLATNLGRAIAVVAHNVVNRCYLAAVLGLPLEFYRRITQDNCGITILEHRSGRTQVLTINSEWHLTKEN